jgi:hypothetical protein
LDGSFNRQLTSDRKQAIEIDLNKYGFDFTAIELAEALKGTPGLVGTRPYNFYLTVYTTDAAATMDRVLDVAQGLRRRKQTEALKNAVHKIENLKLQPDQKTGKIRKVRSSTTVYIVNLNDFRSWLTETKQQYSLRNTINGYAKIEHCSLPDNEIITITPLHGVSRATVERIVKEVLLHKCRTYFKNRLG